MKTVRLWAGALPLLFATAAAAGPANMPGVDWAGLSVGLAAGYSWGQSSHDTYTSGGTYLGSGTSNPSGAFGGVRFAYDFDVAPNMIAGIGGGATLNDVTATSTSGGVTSASTTKWGVSLRGRLGFTKDIYMLYGTAGWHWGGGSVTRTQSGVSETVDTASNGWTLGAGIEWVFAPRWTTFLEYNHVTGTGKTTFPVAKRYSNVSSASDSIETGINYKF